MKYAYTLLGLGFLLIILIVLKAQNSSSPNLVVEEQPTAPQETSTNEDVRITPIAHASFLLEFGGVTIYNDPIGETAEYGAYAQPDIILLSDIHGDHLNVETLSGVVASQTVLVAPQVVFDALPGLLQAQARVLNNEESLILNDIQITAVAMYNLPEQGIDIRHEKGRGNGYLLEKEGTRVYIAGDTADIPEMRALTDIDVAFVPMNLPYTMGVEAAADAVLDFAPAKVIPYHYRTPEGFSDIEVFTRLVREGNEAIEVELLDWYPTAE